MGYLETIEGLEAEYDYFDKINENSTLAINELEDFFSERGLSFDTGFENAAPVQAYGTVDGRHFYFRLRHGIASLRIGEIDPNVIVAEGERVVPHVVEYSSYIKHGGELNGIMIDKAEMIHVFTVLMETLTEGDADYVV